MENKTEIVMVERFFTRYKIFWATVYFMLAVGGVKISQELLTVVYGQDFLIEKLARR